MNYEQMQRQAQALGPAWYVQSESPSSGNVIWLDLADHARFGMSPMEHETLGGIRWYMALETDDGPTHIEHVLLTSEEPARVAARAKALMEVWEVKAESGAGVNAGPTTVGKAARFDYGRFRFGNAFSIPKSYVVAYGVAHFRGPDGYLWLAPGDAGKDTTGQIKWDSAENVAWFDERDVPADDPEQHDPQYRAVMARICRLVDATLGATEAYDRLFNHVL